MAIAAARLTNCWSWTRSSTCCAMPQGSSIWALRPAAGRRWCGASGPGLEVEPIEGVTILQMDFMADEAPQALADALDGPPDLVLSDMAANTVGHKQTDHLRTMGLVETAADFAVQHLAPGGAFVAKVLAGGTDKDLLDLLKRHFTSVKHAKPPASRKGSSEWYVIAKGFKGRSD